jgi:RNA polymerase sigma factor (sigma-70 family)
MKILFLAFLLLSLTSEAHTTPTDCYYLLLTSVAAKRHTPKQIKELIKQADIVYFHTKDFEDKKKVAEMLSDPLPHPIAKHTSQFENEDTFFLYSYEPFPSDVQLRLFKIMNYYRYRATIAKTQVELEIALEKATEIRSLLIQTNLRLIGKPVRYYNERFPDYREQILDAAMDGLANAIDKFNFRRGLKPTTYLYPGIKGRIWGRLMHLIKKEENKATNVDIYSDFIADTREDKATVIDGLDYLKAHLKTLDARAQKIIQMRFFKELTLEECAQILGLSKERVRQIENESLNILRAKLPE